MINKVFVSFRTRPRQSPLPVLSGSCSFATTLDAVALSYPLKKRVTAFTFRDASLNKPPICMAVTSWISNVVGDDEVCFVGFAIKDFFLLLAADMLLVKPAFGVVSRWHDGTIINTKDIGDALRVLSGVGDLLEAVLKTGIAVKDKWLSPGTDIHADLDLVAELSVLMGIV